MYQLEKTPMQSHSAQQTVVSTLIRERLSQRQCPNSKHGGNALIRILSTLLLRNSEILHRIEMQLALR